jgi:hypothetical protein
MPDSGVDVSIYRNQPDPLGTASKVFGLVNTAQQNQLLQQAEQIRNFEARQQQADDLRTTIGTLANRPGTTRAQIIATAAQRARQIQPMPGVFEEAVAPFQNATEADIPKLLGNYGAQASGIPGITARTNVINPQGAQYSVPSTSLIASPAQTGLRPGISEAASGMGTGSAGMANTLTQAAATSMTRKGMLGNLEEDLQHFTSGPGADWTKLAKAWVNRNVPVPKTWQDTGGILDPKSIASQEQFIKQSAMLANAQFQSLGGTGTDNQFNTTFSTSPNEALSQLGNNGIIRLFKGNEDAIQAQNKEWRAWLKAGNPADSFADFQSDFQSHFDPRAFQFKYIPAKERQSYINNMDPADRQRFLHDLTYARKKSWVNFSVGK